MNCSGLLHLAVLLCNFLLLTLSLSESPRKFVSKNQSQRPNEQGGERRSFNSNKSKFEFEGKDESKKDSDKWKSGYVFNQYNRKQQRNDPWWMRDEESNNPRIMPQYLPWWFGPNSSSEDFKSSSHKVADLRELAQQRGIPNVGLKKAELAELLTKVNALYDLSDNNFRQPTFHERDKQKPLPNCYPDNYEGSPENIEALRKRIALVPPADASTPSSK